MSQPINRFEYGFFDELQKLAEDSIDMTTPKEERGNPTQEEVEVAPPAHMRRRKKRPMPNPQIKITDNDDNAELPPNETASAGAADGNF